MERLLLVELVAVGGAHDVRVHVLLCDEEAAVADHRVLEESGTVVESVLCLRDVAVVVQLDARVASAPVNLVLGLRALDGRAEVGGPVVGLEVRCRVKHCLFAIPAADGVQRVVLSRDLNRVEPSQ